MFKGWKRPEKEFFDEFQKELEEMNNTVESMIRTLGKDPYVYGFSMMVGPDGVPHVERFGNVMPESGENDVREPYTSSLINEKSKELYITADMPGVQKDNIEISATENEVVLKAEGDGRKYYKSEKTPPIDPDTATAKYNNGVLEVAFKLKDTQKHKRKTVKIE